jgi:hypothetical protein
LASQPGGTRGTAGAVGVVGNGKLGVDIYARQLSWGRPIMFWKKTELYERTGHFAAEKVQALSVIIIMKTMEIVTREPRMGDLGDIVYEEAAEQMWHR